jgi:predicted Zn-ribbon and HTH transcriptional regulator
MDIFTFSMSNERKKTIRQEIISLLENGPLTARDISQSVSIMEKDVSHHLAFIEKTVRHQKKRIHAEPYHCLDCGFQFKDRKTFKKPSKCPGCKDGRIAPAVFWITSQND